MKKMLFVLIVVFAFALTGLAEGIKPVFYGCGGISLPLKPSEIEGNAPLEIGIGDMYKMGTSFGGGIGFEINPKFDIICRVNYSSYSFDDESFSNKLESEFERLTYGSGDVDFTTNVEGGNLELLEFMADIKFSVPLGGDNSKLSPYVIGGLGMCQTTIAASEFEMRIVIPTLVDTTFIESTPEESETKLSFNIGGGFDYMVSPTVGIFVDVRYFQVAMEGDPIGVLPVRGGILIKLGD